MQIHEQRLTRRLLNYWQLLRKLKDYPEIVQWNSGAIDDVWGYCLRLALLPQKGVFQYEYMGEHIVDIYGGDLTGQILSQPSPMFPGISLHRKIHDAAEGIPVEDEGFCIGENGAMIRYRACLLPFGSKRAGVTHVVIGLSCRTF